MVFRLALIQISTAGAVLWLLVKRMKEDKAIIFG